MIQVNASRTNIGCVSSRTSKISLYCIQICRQICTCVLYMRVRFWVRVCGCECVCVCVCVFCIYMYTHTFTHSLTHQQSHTFIAKHPPRRRVAGVLQRLAGVQLACCTLASRRVAACCTHFACQNRLLHAC